MRALIVGLMRLSGGVSHRWGCDTECRLEPDCSQDRWQMQAGSRKAKRPSERRKCDELTETGCGGPRPASECQGDPRRGGIRAWRDDVVPRMIQDRRCEK